MSEDLVNLRDQYLEQARIYLNESNMVNKVNFWKESHEDEDDQTKKQNAESIREIFELANAATTNLRYGDGSSNSAIQENFDPMGDENGKMTQKETEMMKTYVISSNVEEFDGEYYIRSSTGKHQPDLAYNNRWCITRMTMLFQQCFQRQ